MKDNNKRILLLITFCCHAIPCFATNFNDGINPDGPIQSQIQTDVNIEYIIQKATARSKNGNNKVLTTGRGNAGIGNIIVGPKTNLKGAIIINQSENVDAAVISE
jgi:hypothetical protein